MNKTKSTTFIISLLIIAFSIAAFIFSFRLTFKADYNKGMAKQGQIDLRGWDINKTDYIPLKGEWEFYWKEFISPNDTLASNNVGSNYINLPGVWNNHIYDNDTTTAFGWATYRLKIKLPQKGEYALRIKELDCAYRLWVNNKYYTSSGQPGTSAETEIPNWQRQELYFTTDSNTAQITLQVSNFNHRKGGAEDTILLGSSGSIRKHKTQLTLFTAILAGILIFCTLHYFLTFLLRSKDKPSGIFALLCIFLLIRLGLTGEKVLLEIFPGLSWNIAIRLEYLSYVLITPVLLAFYTKMFPKVFSLKLLRAIQIISIITSISIVILKPQVFSYTPIGFQWIIAAATIYTVVNLILASVKGYSHAFILLAGFVCFMLPVANDILYYNKVIESSFLVPVGFLSLILTQSFSLSAKSSLSHLKVEKLTQKLIDTNKSLEETVAKRTHRIQKQNEELGDRANKLEQTNIKLTNLTKFKEEMTNMIIHDLKNPLNTVINICSLTDINPHKKTIELAGKTMLNLIMNTLDVYRFKESAIKPVLKKVHIPELINSAAKDMQFQASISNISFDINYQTDLTIIADKELINRVLINIISNAIKHSPKNSTIKLTAKEDDAFISIDIKDQGIGISQEMQNKIFGKFTQDAIPENDTQSTGLGLAFCKLAIEAHLGVIGVESEPNMGANFWIKLPKLKDEQLGPQKHINKSDQNHT